MERIIVNNVSKKFQIGFKKNQGALARFISVFSGREPKRELWALQNISFQAKAGEIIGIIGSNASGKSTLLRVIGGIYEKDGGTIRINGKIISLISLNVGLKEKLTMKDNIYLCCSLFGLGQREIKEGFSSIVEFAELEDFINTKIYQFSEGMKARLVFSIAIHCNPEIFLLDEFFEMGDEIFKEKWQNKIKELVKSGITVLMVSHDLNLFKKYCPKIIWLDGGKILMEGDSKEVIKEYLKAFGGK